VASRPSVSVIIPNFNGRVQLEKCVGSLEHSRRPGAALEILVVDNGSRDDSVAFLEARFPAVRIVELPENVGYSPAANLGARDASNEILVFLNNDTWVERDWLEPLVDAIAAGEADAASAKLLGEQDHTIDFAGGGSNFHGVAFELGLGEPDGEQWSRRGPTLFACGAAEAIRRDTFLEAGGFDSDFFAYYEDFDLGWRLWVLGKKVLYVPESRVHHSHSATSHRIPVHKKRVLHFRNPLYSVIKNYDDESLRRVLPAAVMLNVRRSHFLADIDPLPFRIGSAPDGSHDRDDEPLAGAASKGVSASPNLAGGRDPDETIPFPRIAASDWIAWEDLLGGFPRLLKERQKIQSRRRRPDSEILPLFVDPFRAVEQGSEYLELQRTLESLFGIDALFPAFEKRPAGPSHAPIGVGRS
jgi:GT2 family glycosyltransferase